MNKNYLVRFPKCSQLWKGVYIIMEEAVLKAEERTEKPKKTRAAGFIPGNLYGAGLAATTVKFDAAALNRFISKFGSNAKVWVDLNNTQKFGFIKEVQRHPVEGRVIHIDVQLVAQDQEFKLQLPVTFTGIEELEKRQLILLIAKHEAEVVGKANLMPNVISVDVADKELGDTITFQDFGLDKEIKSNEGEEEIYAVIKAKKETAAPEESAEETAPEEPREEETV